MTTRQTAASGSLRTGAIEDGKLPAYDQAAISKVVSRVEIETVDLAGSFFWRRDDGAFAEATGETKPEFGIDPKWWLSQNEKRLSCVISFSAFFPQDDPPFELVATYRITYVLDAGASVTDEELSIFTCWNALFNTWPYWREFVGTTLARAQLPAIAVPVMRVPGWDKKLQQEE